ncbi:MAG: acetyl-CoA C-acetyltransferase [Microbacteriaceae bacterium]|nr:acetyl-CoA C-acetyltransferase [Microbacteriaceae bacterium]
MANEAKPTDVVIVGAARTPQGKIKGQLSSFSAADLGAFAITGALKNAGATPKDVEYVIMGQVILAGSGQNPARQAAIKAGIGWDVPAQIVNKVCLSGLTAIIDGARIIRSGEAKVVVAGGQESMTNAPHLLMGSRFGWTYGSFEAVDSLNRDGLIDSFDDITMGALTQKHTDELGIARDAQDAFSARSHQRAHKASTDGSLVDEIVPITVTLRGGEEKILDTDEGIRGDSTPETLGKLRPAFAKEGTITAGNASPLSDGAAATVITSRAHAEAKGWKVLATLGAPGQVAGPDNSLPAQPAHAIEKALKTEGWTVNDLDYIEINEAFASVGIHSNALLGADPEKVNVHGGGIAIGHPVGASGARLAVHLAHTLNKKGSGKAAAALCGGGGQGEALLFWV